MTPLKDEWDAMRVSAANAHAVWSSLDPGVRRVHVMEVLSRARERVERRDIGWGLIEEELGRSTVVADVVAARLIRRARALREIDNAMLLALQEEL